eukprot:gene7310-3501_t
MQTDRRARLLPHGTHLAPDCGSQVADCTPNTPPERSPIRVADRKSYAIADLPPIHATNCKSHLVADLCVAYCKSDLIAHAPPIHAADGESHAIADCPAVIHADRVTDPALQGGRHARRRGRRERHLQ